MFTEQMVSPFSVTIFVGNSHPGWHQALPVIKDYCRTCVTKDSDHPPGICVTFQSITFIHRDGEEYGYKIGLVNYPRFPKTEDQLMSHARELAHLLIDKLGQKTALIDSPIGTFWVCKNEPEVQQSEVQVPCCEGDGWKVSEVQNPPSEGLPT